MEDFSKRDKRGRVMFRLVRKTLGVVFLAILAIFAVRASWGMYERFNQAVESQEGAQERLALLIAKKEKVEDEVEHLDSARGIEAQVRERYGVARPGEGRIEIVRNSTSTASVVNEPGNPIIKFFKALWPF